ncbi:MAG: potassium channel family protein, partial [Acidimicrobiales bacterium]
PEGSVSPLEALLLRFVVALGLLTLLVLIVYVDRRAYIDNNDPKGYVDLVDSIYYATVTITTTGYGDITPVTPSARLINAFVVTPLRIGFLILLVGTTLEVLANQGRQMWRVARWRKHMDDHIVVIGYGTKGRSAVAVLLRNGEEKDAIVVVDPRSDAADEAQDDGLTAVVGDATRREVLRRAEIGRARQVVITTDRDDSAVLITLTVRQLNPTAKLIASVRENDNVSLVRQSGADSVITSSEAVGRLLGLSTVSPSLGAVLEDLLTYGDGLEVAERAVLPTEIGQQPQKLLDQVLAVVRDGEMFRYFDPTVTQLSPGDRVVVVRPSEETPWAARPGAES